MTRALGAALLGALVVIPAAATHGIKDGGTFRVAIPVGQFVSVDPLVGHNLFVTRAICASLMTFPAKPLPEGFRLVPEIAADYPKVTNGGTTYTFTIRKGVRFSTGSPVTARSFAHTLNRLLNPRMESEGVGAFADILGAQKVLDGKAETASGVTARGNTLIIRLKKPVGDFEVRTSDLCVVPETTPIDPEGVSAPAPSSGPYYADQYVPGQRLVLERNRFYHGPRPGHVNRFVIDLTLDAATALDRVDRGELDFAGASNPAYADRAEEFRRKYGINKSRFWTVPDKNLRMFVLNTSGALFRNNVQLRQAVNFAVDRPMLSREFGPTAATTTDQYIPSVLPGFTNETIYPLKGPNLKKAKGLAKGRTRSGNVVLYTCDSPTCVAQAQILKRNLKAIGLQLETVSFPLFVLFEKLATDRAGFDIGWGGVVMVGPEGVGDLFDGRTIGQPENGNYSYFDSPKFNRLIAQAAALPLGRAREDAYGDLDVKLAREAAPAIAFGVLNDITFVSARVGCIVFNPGVDITAVCLK